MKRINENKKNFKKNITFLLTIQQMYRVNQSLKNGTGKKSKITQKSGKIRKKSFHFSLLSRIIKVQKIKIRGDNNVSIL